MIASVQRAPRRTLWIDEVAFEAARVGYGREMTTTLQEPFALTGLTSRGGLSNWVLFVFPTEMVIVDAGLSAAIKAGVQAGVRSQLGLVGQVVLGRPAYGPQKSDHEALETWCSALLELFVGGADGKIWRFGMMNRKAAEAHVAPLTGRFALSLPGIHEPRLLFLQALRAVSHALMRRGAGEGMRAVAGDRRATPLPSAAGNRA